MTALQAVCEGKLGLAYIISAGYPKGERIMINTKTAPNSGGDHFMWATIDHVTKDGRIVTRESDPFLGYNTFDKDQVIG